MIRKENLSSELLQKIKNAVNILEIVGEHVVLRRSGSNFSGLCPFHAEKTPSFSVSENKQLYHCHGCKRGGDLVTFTMEVLGISFPEAVKELADRARIPLPQNWNRKPGGSQAQEDRSTQNQKETLAYKLNRFSAAFFHQNFIQDPHAQEYCRLRGVDEEGVKSFYLGWAPPSWDLLAQHLKTQKAPLEIAVELGLIRPSRQNGSGRKDGPGYFDLFRNRIIFPVLNLRGRVAGFGGRSLSSDAPKYLNSSESFIFHKSQLVYGLWQAQKHIRSQDEIILVEGYFDVLAMQAAGFQNVVGISGTALTADHLSIFRRLANRVIVLFDGDQAGDNATEKAMELGLDLGQVLYQARMPKDLDPDEILFDSELKKISKEGVEQMSEILKGSQAILDLKTEAAIRQAQESPEGLSQALKKMGAWLARFQDPVGREVRLESIQSRLGLSRSLLEQAMGKGSKIPFRKTYGAQNLRQGVSGSAAQSPAMLQSDQILLKGVAASQACVQAWLEVKGDLPPHLVLSDLVEYAPARNFVAFLFSQPEGSQVFDQLRTQPKIFLGPELDHQVRSMMIEALLSVGPAVDLDTFKGALMKSLGRTWKRFSHRIESAMKDPKIREDSGQHSQLLKEYLDVQRKIKEFTNFYDEE